MSVVPPTGVLRYLYQDAVADIEYKSSAFWQVFLQTAFPLDEGFIVVCEFPPDQSRRRVDIVVRYYDGMHHTLASFLFTECKKPGGTTQAQEVEAQARQAAETAIETDHLTIIYAMTTIGTAFRIWFMESGTGELNPFHGDGGFGDRSQYIDADSPESVGLWDAIRVVKGNRPLKRVGKDYVLPSQGDIAAGGWDDNEEMDDDEVYGDEQGLYSNRAAGEMGESSKTMETGASSSIPQDSMEMVVAKRVRHLTRADEVTFEDRKNKKRSTRPDEWQKKKINGKTVWLHHTKGAIYATKSIE